MKDPSYYDFEKSVEVKTARKDARREATFFGEPRAASMAPLKVSLSVQSWFKDLTGNVIESWLQEQSSDIVWVTGRPDLGMSQLPAFKPGMPANLAEEVRQREAARARGEAREYAERVARVRVSGPALRLQVSRLVAGHARVQEMVMSEFIRWWAFGDDHGHRIQVPTLDTDRVLSEHLGTSNPADTMLSNDRNTPPELTGGAA